MKRKAIKNATRLRYSVAFITIAIFCLAKTGVYAAEPTTPADGVVLIHLQYDHGQWQLGKDGVRILPCDPPNDFKRGTKQDPLFRVFGDGRKLLYEKNIRNPRLILFEDRDKKSQLLEKLSFNLRFAYRKGMQIFEFYKTANRIDQDKPVVIVDMREAITHLDEMVKSGKRLPCQQPQLK